MFLTRKFNYITIDKKEEKVEDGGDATNIPTHVLVLRRETARVGNVPDVQMPSDVETQLGSDVKMTWIVVPENVLETNAPIAIA